MANAFPFSTWCCGASWKPEMCLTSHFALCVSNCCKNHLWFQFPSGNQPWSTFWQGNETVKKIPYAIPLHWEKGIPEDTDIPIDHSHVPKFCQRLQPQEKTIGPWAFRTFLNRGNSKQFPGQHDICMLLTANSWQQNWTVLLHVIAASLLTRQPNDPAATHSTLPYPRAY